MPKRISENVQTTTLRIAGSRKELAESLTLAISQKCKKVIRVSEVLHFVLDKHLNPLLVDAYFEEYKRKRSGVKVEESQD